MGICIPLETSIGDAGSGISATSGYDDKCQECCVGRLAEGTPRDLESAGGPGVWGYRAFDPAKVVNGEGGSGAHRLRGGGKVLRWPAGRLKNARSWDCHAPGLQYSENSWPRGDHYTLPAIVRREGEGESHEREVLLKV